MINENISVGDEVYMDTLLNESLSVPRPIPVQIRGIVLYKDEFGNCAVIFDDGFIMETNRQLSAVDLELPTAILCVTGLVASVNYMHERKGA